jgi:hypothetical protein
VVPDRRQLAPAKAVCRQSCHFPAQRPIAAYLSVPDIPISAGQISSVEAFMPRQMKVEWLVGGFAILFGALTVITGGVALFANPATREAFGNVVAFVLWFNFIAGFAYLAAGGGIVARRKWAVPISVGIATATLVVFIGFAIHALTGGLYEMRTVGAMTLRTLAWFAIAAFTIRAGRKWGAGEAS